jgi:hypothetical protein
MLELEGGFFYSLSPNSFIVGGEGFQGFGGIAT